MRPCGQFDRHCGHVNSILVGLVVQKYTLLNAERFFLVVFTEQVERTDFRMLPNPEFLAGRSGDVSKFAISLRIQRRFMRYMIEVALSHFALSLICWSVPDLFSPLFPMHCTQVGSHLSQGGHSIYPAQPHRVPEPSGARHPLYLTCIQVHQFHCATTAA